MSTATVVYTRSAKGETSESGGVYTLGFTNSTGFTAGSGKKITSIRVEFTEIRSKSSYSHNGDFPVYVTTSDWVYGNNPIGYLVSDGSSDTYVPPSGASAGNTVKGTIALSASDQTNLASRTITKIELGQVNVDWVDYDIQCNASSTCTATFTYEDATSETPKQCKTPTGLTLGGLSSGTAKTYTLSNGNPNPVTFSWAGPASNYSDTANTCSGFEAQWENASWTSDPDEWHALYSGSSTSTDATPFAYYRVKLRVRALSSSGTESLHSDWAYYNGDVRYVMRTSNPSFSSSSVTTGATATINWTFTPANDAYLSGFQVLDSSNSVVATVGSSARSASFTAPSSAGTYSYYVKPTSTSNLTETERSVSAASLSVSAATQTAPGAPTNVSFSSSSSVTTKYVNANSVSSTTLYWTAPSSLGSNTSVTYNIYRDGSIAYQSVSGTSRSVSVPSTAGSYYTYTVAAVGNNYGTSAVSTTSATVYSYKDLSVTFKANNITTTPQYVKRGISIPLSWSATGDSYNTVSSYTLYQDSSAILSNTTSTSTTISTTSLTDSYYDYKVTAAGSRGTSTTSSIITIRLYSDPSAPTNIKVNGSSTATVAPNSSVTISWDAATFDTYNAKSGYTVYSSTSPSSGYSAATSKITSGTSTTYTVPSTPGTYYIKVVANGERSNSEYSAYATIVVEGTPETDPKCKAPSSITVSPASSSGSAVTLSWTAGTPGDGNPITGYEIQRRLYSSSLGSWGSYSAYEVTNSSTLSLTDVLPPDTAGDKYQYRVRTLCADSANYSDWATSSSSAVLTRSQSTPVPPVVEATTSGISFYHQGSMVKSFVNYYTGSEFKRCNVYRYDGSGFKLMGWKTGGSSDDTIHVTDIKISHGGYQISSIELPAGSTAQLSTVITPSDATDQRVSWSSTSSAVSVSQTGNLTFNSTGSATITVTTVDGNHSASITATCKSASVPVTGVSINPVNKTISVGDTFTLTVSVSPSNATNKAIEFSLDSESANYLRISPNADQVSCDVTGLASTSGTRYIGVNVSPVDKTNTLNYFCSVTVEESSTTKPVTSYSLTPSSKTLAVGDTFTLYATNISPTDATNKTATFSIPAAYSSYLRINSSTSLSCEVEALRAISSATVNVSMSGIEHQCDVTVTAVSTELDATIYIEAPSTYAGSGTYARIDSDTISSFEGVTWSCVKNGTSTNAIIYDSRNIVDYSSGANIPYGYNERYLVFESAGTYTVTVTLNGKSKSATISVASSTTGLIQVYAKNLFDMGNTTNNTLLNSEEFFSYDTTTGDSTFTRRNSSYLAGAAYAESGYKTSGYIDISAYAEHTISFVKIHSACWYDSSYNYIKSISTTKRLKEGTAEVTAVVPPTAKYVRVSLINTDILYAQVGPGVRDSSYINYDEEKYFSHGYSLVHAIRTTPYDLIVNGVHNMINEYRDEFDHDGINIWSEMTTRDAAGQVWEDFAPGIPIKNRAVTFKSGALLLCDFNAARVPTDNAGYIRKFSALAVVRNATLIDMHLHIVGGYYGIHDDYEDGYNWATDPEFSDGVFKLYYTNVYRGCTLISLQCASADVIGAGTGTYSTTLIENCTLDNGRPDLYTLRYHTPWYGDGHFAVFPWLKTQGTTHVTLNNCRLTNAFRVGYAGGKRDWNARYDLNNCTKLNGVTPIKIEKVSDGGVSDDTVTYRNGVKVTSFPSYS